MTDEADDGERRFSFYTSGEAVTAGGCLVQFTCDPKDVEAVRAFLQERVRSVCVPVTSCIRRADGESHFVGYSRYDAIVHRYAGAEVGYLQIIEIKNPPDGRHGIVMDVFDGHYGGRFIEWETIEHALAAFDHCCARNMTVIEAASDQPGFIRGVSYGALTPWFYAVGQEVLIGDYVLPRDLQDDPVYRLGAQFVVSQLCESSVIKTCMGTRWVSYRRREYPHDTTRYRIVYWSDGSTWNEYNSYRNPPRPLEGGRRWIFEAMQRFLGLLTGRSDEFTIDLTDGYRFTGQLHRPKSSPHTKEGTYHIVLRVKGEENDRKGAFQFEPTFDAPDVVQAIAQKLAEQGKTIERIEVRVVDSARKGKKWSGVFFGV